CRAGRRQIGCPVDDSVIHALVQRDGRFCPATAEGTATGERSPAEPFRTSLADAGWLVCAFPWPWLGKEANQKRPPRIRWWWYQEALMRKPVGLTLVSFLAVAARAAAPARPIFTGLGDIHRQRP